MKILKYFLFSTVLLCIISCNNKDLNNNSSVNSEISISIPTYTQEEINEFKENYEYEGIIEEGNVTVTKYVGDDIEVVIPDFVKIIGISAFKDCTHIKTVNLSNRVESIGENAFYNCESMQQINLPNSLTYIGTNAFGKCKSLNYNEYENGKYLGNESNPYLFFSRLIDNSVSDVIINDETYIIANRAFYINENIQSITIGSKLKYIMAEAFYGCKFLKNLYYKGDIGSWCMIDFEKESSTPFNSAYPIKNFYMLNNNSEWENTKIIDIPETINEIRKYTFYAFPITNVNMSDNVTNIGSYAFYNCSSLGNIKFSNNLINIESSAFYSCSFENIELPDSVESIGSEAFGHCDKLESIIFGKNIKLFKRDVFVYCSKLDNLFYKGSIEDWCNINYESSYSNPLGYVTYFYMLDENKEWYEVTNIEIPSSLNGIGQFQFYSFDGLKELIIPKEITNISYLAFCFCKNIDKVYYKGTAKDWNNISFPEYPLASSMTGRATGSPVKYAKEFYVYDSNGNWILAEKTMDSNGNYVLVDK